MGVANFRLDISLDVNNSNRVLVVGAPCDRVRPLRDVSTPIEPSEVPLNEAVVQPVGGCEFSPPVAREADFDHSLLDVVAEEVCHLSRFLDTIQLGCGDTVDLCESLDYLSVVLAEAFRHRVQRCTSIVESHWIERVVSIHPVKSRVYICDSVRSCVANVLWGVRVRVGSCGEIPWTTGVRIGFV